MCKSSFVQKELCQDIFHNKTKILLRPSRKSTQKQMTEDDQITDLVYFGFL